MFLVRLECCGKGDGLLPDSLYLISFCHEVFYSSDLSCLFSGKFQKPKSELMVRNPRGASRSWIVSCFHLFQIQCSDNFLKWFSFNCVSQSYKKHFLTLSATCSAAFWAWIKRERNWSIPLLGLIQSKIFLGVDEIREESSGQDVSLY